MEKICNPFPWEWLPEGSEVSFLVKAFVVGFEDSQVVNTGQPFELLHPRLLLLWLRVVGFKLYLPLNFLPMILEGGIGEY